VETSILKNFNNFPEKALEKGIIDDDVLVFDVAKNQFEKNLDLPQLPEPAATVLLENLKSLDEKKNTFIKTLAESKLNIVFFF